MKYEDKYKFNINQELNQITDIIHFFSEVINFIIDTGKLKEFQDWQKDQCIKELEAK